MEFISMMELIGTVAFAVAGALVAIEKGLDYYGILFFAIITAVGGGIIRDVLIDLPLPVALTNPLYVLLSIGTGIVLILFYRRLVKYQNLLLFFDAIGLAAFTAIGAHSALVHDVYTPFVVITLAVLTGTGGGSLRDVFAGDIPFVFRKEVYAVASVVGAVAFMAAFYVLKQRQVSMYICFGVTLAIRLLAMKYDWHLAKVRLAEAGTEGGSEPKTPARDSNHRK